MSISESPLDRALSLLLLDKREDALAVLIPLLEHDPHSASVLYVLGRLLAGVSPKATAAYALAASRAVESGDLGLAVAAAHDKADGASLYEAIAATFSKGMRSAGSGAVQPPSLQSKPVLPTLTLRGAELLARAESALVTAAAAPAKPSIRSALTPVLSSLEESDLAALLATLEPRLVKVDETVVREGEEGTEAYIVARGELEVRKASESRDAAPVALTRLTRGMMFGEMALLAQAPRVATVVAVRPSVVLVVKREALVAVAQKHADVARELAAHCRSRMIANVVRTSPVLLAVPHEERNDLVERFQMRVFDKSERIIKQGDEPKGIHLIASGEVAVVREEGDESLVLSTLGAGHVVGEVALVLRRQANADVVAVHPTISLFLPREEFLSVVKDHPGTLHGLYLLAVARDEETSMVVANATISVGDDVLV